MNLSKMDQVLNEAVTLLNKQFKVTPILYASFNLEKVLNRGFDAHDIDIFIPQDLFVQKEQLISSFTNNGFTYIPQEVLTFVKNEVEVEIAHKERWFNASQLKENGIIEVSIPGGRYSMLNADNLLSLYKHLSVLPNRNETKIKKDLLKIKALEVYLKPTK